MKYVRPIDPVSTWHLLNENEEDAIFLLVVFLKPTETMTKTNNIGFHHLKIQGTKRPILQYNKELSVNYETCKI